MNEQHAAYDDAATVTSCGLPRDNRNHRKKRLAIINATAAGPDNHVLEVGCGHGIHAAWYDSFFERFEAVDLSPSLCAETAERIDGDVLQADATMLPHADDAVDAVVGTAILHHLPDAAAALREWCRVARESVTLAEPNYLFPLAFATAHVLPEERHKTQMAPWRVRRMLRTVADECDGAWCHEPFLYTPPWPDVTLGVYDALDTVGESLPGLRWAGQMQLIHVRL